MIARHLEPYLRRNATYYPVVTLTGPRQSGKTTLCREEPPLYFWRVQTGHEIDLLIDQAGALFPCEIKSGATIQTEMLKTLKWWNALTKNPATSSALIYGGSEHSERNSIRIRPWFAV